VFQFNFIDKSANIRRILVAFWIEKRLKPSKNLGGECGF